MIGGVSEVFLYFQPAGRLKVSFTHDRRGVCNAPLLTTGGVSEAFLYLRPAGRQKASFAHDRRGVCNAPLLTTGGVSEAFLYSRPAGVSEVFLYSWPAGRQKASFALDRRECRKYFFTHGRLGARKLPLLTTGGMPEAFLYSRSAGVSEVFLYSWPAGRQKASFALDRRGYRKYFFTHGRLCVGSIPLLMTGWVPEILLYS